MRTFVAGAFAALLVGLTPANSGAQDFPQQPITLVVPLAAGGGADIVGRRLAELMSKELGQRVLIENKPGAGSMIGAEYVKNAMPDGYTLLLAQSSTLSFAPAAYRNARYSAADFDPVSGYIDYSFGIAARKGAPFADMKSFIEYAKANPRKVRFGTTGRGGAVHMLQLLIDRRTGVETIDVPYQGGAPALQDILGERLDIYADGILNLVPLYKDRTVKLIAVTGDRDTAALPGVSNLDDAGYPDLVLTSWTNVVAPKGTPPAVIERLNKAVKAATENSELRKWLAESGYEVAYSTPEEERRKMNDHASLWKARFEEFGIRLD